MKKLIATVCICILSVTGFAQQTNLTGFNKERERLSRTGIKGLAIYSAANIIYGSIASSQTTGSNKYFHEMNAIWNGITLGITGIGFLTANKESTLSYGESLKKQQHIEKLFLFNAGLDVAYIAGGAYLKERAKTTIKNPLRLKGYGESIMLQGVVLLLFDGIMYTIHNRHGILLNKMGENIKLASTPNGIGFIVKL